MNPSNATSAAASATTSNSGQKTRDDYDGSAPHSTSDGKSAEKLSESEFLQEQAEAAKAAIADAFSDLKADLAKGADPRIWMKSHPWLTLASATVAGFAAAAAVVPSKEQQALKKLEAVERALHRARTPEASAAETNGKAKPEHRGMIAMLLHELFGALKPVIIGLVTSHFAPPAEPETKSEHSARDDQG